MPIAATKVTVTTTATLIASSAGVTMGDRKTVIIKNASAAMFLGGATVDTTNGMPLATTESVAIDLGPGDSLYGIVAAATATINVLTTRV